MLYYSEKSARIVKVIMRRDDEQPRFSVWVFLIPVFIFAAWPALQWMKKAGSDDLRLSKDDYSLFNSQEGGISKPPPFTREMPELNDGVMGVRYKSKARKLADEKNAAIQREKDRAAAKKRAEEAAIANRHHGGTDSLHTREQQSTGSTVGFLTSAVGRLLNNPKAVGALLNNKYVVKGFMARDTVKEATASKQSLARYLKSGSPANFINNPVVKAAINKPAVVREAASSGLIKALLDTPGVKALMNDPKALGELLNSNPELATLAMTNPNIMNALINNPAAAGLLSNLGKK